MTLEQLIVAFGSTGAEKLKKQVSDLDKRLEKFAKKYAKEQMEADKSIYQYRSKVVNATMLMNKNLSKAISKDSRKQFEQELHQVVRLKKIYDAMGRKRSKKNRPAVGSTAIPNSEEADAQQPKARTAEASKRLATGMLKMSALLLTIAGMLKTLNNNIKEDRLTRIKYSNMLNQVGGMNRRNAMGFDLMVQKYGGGKGEGIQTLKSFTSAIGAMKYGDNSLAEVLGRFGIGGIHSGSTAEDVLRAIANAAQGMDKYSQQALFDATNLSDPIQQMIREGKIDEALKSMYEGSSKVDMSAFANQVMADFKAWFTGGENMSSMFKPFTDAISDFKKEHETLANFIENYLLPLGVPLTSLFGGFMLVNKALGTMGTGLVGGLGSFGAKLAGTSAALANLTTAITGVLAFIGGYKAGDWFFNDTELGRQLQYWLFPDNPGGAEWREKKYQEELDYFLKTKEAGRFDAIPEWMWEKFDPHAYEALKESKGDINTTTNNTYIYEGQSSPTGGGVYRPTNANGITVNF